MDVLAQFEYPLPVLAIDIDAIEIETPDIFEGSFNIRNTGGGRIIGQIISHSPAVTFHPSEFENKTKILYRMDVNRFRTGDVVKTGAVILSNGGERYLPIVIRVNTASILTPEGINIADVDMFAEYARQYPKNAEKLLYSSEFKNLLTRTHFEFINIYEKTLSDEDRSRALECFLRLSGLKKAAVVSVLQKQLEINILPFQREKYFGRVPIKLDGWGYVNDTVEVKGGSPWLAPLTGVRRALENSNMLTFSVDPTKITERYSSDALRLCGNPRSEVGISVVRRPFISIALNKEMYGTEDSGYLSVNNYTGMNLLLDVQPSETFIVFDAKGHYIAEQAHIAFYVRPTAFQTLSLKKQPKSVTIDVRCMVQDKLIVKRLALSVGELW
ncbi:MAG: DUF5717 family protein [Clostridiales bacterium]|jgi:hypothetical protein|nr:DUF5717 family protein [Clostridiales bacterium]